MAKVVYLSLTGMTEPLGESQVMQYVCELAKKHSLYLISFEKPTCPEKYHEIATVLQTAQIKWYYYKYSNKFGVFSTAWQIISALLKLQTLIKKENINLIHARSFVPGVISFIIKKKYAVKFLFDIRGFAIDEKITEGRLATNSLLTKFLRKLEDYIYRSADHVVTLTHISKPIIERKYSIATNKISVIPTCANENLFKVLTVAEKKAHRQAMGYSEEDIILLHNGSLNNWIDFDAEMKLFKELTSNEPSIKLLFLNQGQHALIHSYIDKYKLSHGCFRIIAVEFDKVAQYLNIADLCIFFIKPSFAKLASAPTKFAEMVSCHLYSVSNSKYGDIDFYYDLYKVGRLFDLEDVHGKPKEVANQVLQMISAIRSYDKHETNDFNLLFLKHFSKKVAVERYLSIYNLLTKEG